MAKHFDVVSVCNALMDVVFNVTDSDIRSHGLTKGTMHLVERPVQEKLLQQFNGHEQVVELGGSSLNVIRALALLGHPTAFVGAVADDAFGKKIRTQLDTLEIKNHLATVGNHHAITGTCLSLVTPDGERTMVTHLGASRMFTREDIPRKELAGTKIFHYSGYQWDQENQKDAVSFAIAEAKKSGALISFDLADPFVVEHHRLEFCRLVSEADIVFANEAEAKLLYNASPEAAAEKIAADGAIAVIKLGARGALVQRGKEKVLIPIVPTTVIDTTGAGDMFAAGFLHGLCAEHSLAHCGYMAAVLASDVISRYGARLSPEVIAAGRTL